MTIAQLIEHLVWKHGMDSTVVHDYIAPNHISGTGDDWYLRGFHDGLHGRVDADKLDIPHHGHKV